MSGARAFGTRLRHAVATRLRPRGKQAFLQSLPVGARVLDVGCGNNSPRDAKLLRPDLDYTGLDVADYNQQDSIRYADRYIVVSPAEFPDAIAEHAGQMDAVVSSHNLEHCDDPLAVVTAMAGALRQGGRLYLAFPCEASMRFPSRRGCLNFFDDATHQAGPPAWEAVLATLGTCGLTLVYACTRYRPAVLAGAGLVLEPLAILSGRNMPAGTTWALYGFESIIWGRRDVRAQGIPEPSAASVADST